MVKSSRACVRLVCIAVLLSNCSYAVSPDRINGPLNAGPKVALRGNIHGFAKPENDLGHADRSRLIQGITLAFRPSTAQKRDLDQFIAELGNPSSPRYHKYLTPKQFGERFGLSRHDLDNVVTWLQSLGFTNIQIANSRSEVSFDGTVAQLESVFQIEMHHYLVDGIVHLANASEPSLPAAIADSVLNVGHLHNFAPKPRARALPRLTSFVSGGHFLTPGDFAAIYDLTSLGDGAGQKIAVVGQSTVSTTDLSNFRSAAGLPPSTVTMTLQGGTATKCSGDEGESDLDIEWAGGVAKNATVIFVYAGLNTGDACGQARSNSVWDALDYAVQHNVAPFISTSYGFCESGLGLSFAQQVQGWALQGITQGQTIVSASGDAGSADCESGGSSSSTTGLAVDVPASIPEVTGAGGTQFKGDTAGAVSGTAPNTTAASDPPYWLASGTGADGTVITAQQYIPEQAWNDTTNANNTNRTLSASGGGASLYFAKPTWQAGTGVPTDTARDVPDISLSASNYHDSYLLCSEDFSATSCSVGFRESAGGVFSAVGGTSAAAPTFAAILALVNQSLGNAPPTGLAPVNPRLYQLASSYPAAFNDVKTGNNMVACTSGTTNCPSGTTQIGFNAGTGYDQVTGLGSVNGNALAQDFAAAGFLLVPEAASIQVAQGSNGTATVHVTALNGFTGQITYTCSDSVTESTCTGPSTAIDSTQAASFQITTKAPTARLERIFDGGPRILYATLMPGLLGIVFVASSRKRSLRGVRFLGLIMVLGFSTVWLGSCGGSSSGTKDPGTPTGSYTIMITGTSGALTSSASFQLVVVK
jgi:subtilase family serine protease